MCCAQGAIELLPGSAGLLSLFSLGVSTQRMSTNTNPARTLPAPPPYRLFIAIELPAGVRHKISQHTNRLRAELSDVRASWTREENLHLTLKFLGDTPLGKVGQLSQALQRAATNITPFEMQIAGCGAFPPHGQPKVLWIGTTDHSGRLPKLHAALEDECASAGFPRDTRSFHPHLTIARLRQPHGARALAQLHKQTEFDTLSVIVEDVCLIRSELSSEGSRFAVIASHKFA